MTGAARTIAGAILIDKPPGPTSHDVVAFVRRTLKVDRAGHTGTLDPLATGLLIVLVGGATRLAQFLAADEKEYVAGVRLGVATPTYDAASLAQAVGRGREAVGRGPDAVERGPWSDPEIAEVLQRFRGTFMQTPPPFSAKKIASVPAYEKARKNQAVELPPVEVTVRELEHIANDEPTLLRLRVAASAGFYVRSLAHDIGEALGCGAHLETLRRTRVGRFRVDQALTLDRVAEEGMARLTPASTLLGHMPAVAVAEDAAERVTHGNPVKCQTPGEYQRGAASERYVRILDGTGNVLAVAEARPGGLLQPVVVLR